MSGCINKKRDIGSYIPVTVSDSEDDSDSDIDADLACDPDTKEIKINLFDRNAFDPTPKPEVKSRPKRRFTNVMPGQEPLSVFLRVRPILPEEIEAGEDQGCIEIADGHDLLLTAPKSSQNYKNFLHGTSKASHKYTFSKIMEPNVKQKAFFEETTLQTVQDFVNGQNCLVFTYGVTNSGKTYTIQGNSNDPGILPRSLDVLFNSVEAQLDESGRFQPNMFSSVVRLSDEDITRGIKDKKDVMMMSADTENAASNPANTTVNTTVNTTINSTISSETSVLLDPRLSQSSSDRGSLSTTVDSSSRPSLPSISEDLDMLPEINREIENMAVDIQGQGNVKFSIWVSFAEIYNEFIYDLLDKIPTSTKLKKFKRRVLRLSDDPNGNVFIKGLKKINVKNSDEAYRVMLAGQKNLHKAATKLNHNSSRSHCIFTVSLVRIVDAPEPKVARTSMLHLVDLAGSERQKKTGSEGERLKESSNINTTLLTLGRCIQAMKYNQTHPANKHQIVPFRESRLTRLFQTFFQGKGRAMMIVNVNQLASTFDETLHAVKFSAIAKQVVILTQPDPAPKEITEKKIMGPPALPANKNVAKGKTSIAPKPSAKSGPPSDGGANNNNKKGSKASAPATASASASAETTIDLNVTTSSESADGACRSKDVPTEYYTIEQGTHMKATIETLKDNLKKKSRENREMEMRIRQEVTEEMAQQLVKIQDEADERVADAQSTAEEMMEKRIELLQEGFAAQNDRRAHKRRREEEVETGRLTTSMKKRLEEQQHRVETLQTENSKLTFNLSSANSEIKQVKALLTQSSGKGKDLVDEVQRLKDQLKEKAASDSDLISNRELITSLQQQLSAQREKNKEFSAEKDELKVVVEEAATAFMEKESELTELQNQIEQLEGEKAELSSDKDGLSEKVRDLEAGSLRSEGELKSRAEADESEMKRLTEELKEALSRVETSENSAADYAEALKRAESKLARAEENLAAERRKAESATRRLEDLRAEKAAVEANVGTMTSEMEEAANARDERLERLRGELREKSREADALEKELESQKRAFDQLSVDRRDLSTEKEAAVETVADLKRKLAGIEIENENMKAEKSEALVEKDKLNVELDRLLAEEDERTAALKTELESRLKELNEKEEQRKKAAAEAKESKAALNEKIKELMESNATALSGQERIVQLLSDVKEAKMSRNDNHDAVGRVERKLEQTTEELRTMKERLNFKEIEAAKAKADLGELEDKRAEAGIFWNAEREKLERKIAALEDEVKSVNKSTDRKQAEVLDLRCQNEALEREAITSKKEAELRAQELEAKKKEAKEKDEAVRQNYKTIFEEQELALDAQDKVMKQKEEQCERFANEVKALKEKRQEAEKNQNLQKILEEAKRELQAKTDRVELLENELARERKVTEDLKSSADKSKLDSVRKSEKIAEVERLVEAKTGELEAVNREKSEHEAVISFLENQVMEIRNQLATMTESDNSGPEIRRLEAEVESLKTYKLACDKRMSDKEDDLVSARQEIKVLETKHMEEMAKLNEERMRAEDKLNQFKKDRDEIVDQLGALIKKREQKIKELEEKLKQPQSTPKMTAIKKKVQVSDAVEEDFLTASSDSDTNTNESAPVRKRRSAEMAEKAENSNAGKTPDAKASFTRPATEPKRRKTANSAAKTGVRISSRVTRGGTQSVDDHEETSNDASSPPLKPPRTRTADDTDDESKENEKSSKSSSRSTRQSSRKTATSASKTPLIETNENETESDRSDEAEDGAKDKTKSRRKLYSQPVEPVDVKLASVSGELDENWGVSPLLRKLERQERERNPRAGRSTRTRNK